MENRITDIVWSLTERTPAGGERVSQNESNSTPLSHRPERSGIGVDVDEWEVWYFFFINVSFFPFLNE